MMFVSDLNVKFWILIPRCIDTIYIRAHIIKHFRDIFYTLIARYVAFWEPVLGT